MDGQLVGVIVGAIIAGLSGATVQALRNRHQVEGEFRQAVSRYYAYMVGTVDAFYYYKVCGDEMKDKDVADRGMRETYVVKANHYHTCYTEATIAYATIRRYGDNNTQRDVDALEREWNQLQIEPHDEERWNTWRNEYTWKLEQFRDSARIGSRSDSGGN